MLHMYRDVKKTTYTQTQKKPNPYTKHKHTQTTKPHRPVFRVKFQFWTPGRRAATFSLVCDGIWNPCRSRRPGLEVFTEKQQNQQCVRVGEKQ